MDDADLQILTYTLLGEARGEGAEGMLAVANVIANRVDSPIYPDDPVDVVLQDRQFSTNNAGEGGNQAATRREVRPGDALYVTAEQIVRAAIIDRTVPDITGGAINYHATNISPYWAANATTRWGTVTYGNHIYYARRPVPPADIPTVLSSLDVKRVAPVPLDKSTALIARRATATASQRVKEATDLVAANARWAALGFVPAGNQGAGGMSMTSRLGSREDFSDSIAAPRLVDYKAARDELSLTGLLDKRISLTAPNPAPSAADVSRQVLGNGVATADVAPKGPQGRGGKRGTAPAPVEVTVAKPKTRVGDSGLITYIRPTVKIGPDGQPIIEPTPPPKPAITATATATGSANSVKLSATTRVMLAKATASSKAGASANVQTSANVERTSVPALQKTVEQISREADTARLNGYREIQSMGPKSPPAKPVVVSGGATARAGAQMDGKGAAVMLNQAAGTVVAGKDPSRLAAQPAGLPLAAPAPIPLKAPAPLKFAPIVRADPIGKFPDFSELSTMKTTSSKPIGPIEGLRLGLEAEKRRLSGLPPLEPDLPRRDPRTAAAPAPAKTKLTAAPDAPVPLPRPGKVSTATVAPQPVAGSPGSIGAKSPTTKKLADAPKSQPIDITVRGGAVAPRYVPPRRPDTTGPQVFDASKNSLAPVTSTAAQESAFQWTTNTGLPSAVGNSTRWQTGY
jgi:N-acetylmuramoyl-L-alanine amidase